MSSIKGTNVLAPVVPFDTTDSHASHEAKYGKGGYRTVEDNAERDGIPALRREAGMLVWVAATSKAWRLNDNLSTWTEVTAIGAMVAIGASSLEVYQNVAAFPATGAANVLYLSQDTSRIYRWASSAYVEVGPESTGGGGGASTTDASLLTSGTLDEARLSFVPLHPFLLMGG